MLLGTPLGGFGWPHWRHFGAVASLGLAFSPQMEMGELLGHINLLPPGEQQQGFDGEGHLQLLFYLLNALKRV